MVICYFCVIRELRTSTRFVAALTRPSDKDLKSTSISSSLSILRFHCHSESQAIRWPTKKHIKNNNVWLNECKASKLSDNSKFCRSYKSVRLARKQVLFRFNIDFFHVSLFSCMTFFMYHFFCVTFFLYDFFHVWLFLVSLFSRITFFLYHFLPFAVNQVFRLKKVFHFL
jgi:hypothetical protein